MNDVLQKALSLVERGYEVIPIAPGEKRPALSDWVNIESTAANVRRWWQSPQLARGGIGIRTAHTPAVDLDILDEGMVRELESFIVNSFGDAPARVGRHPKRLLLFAAPKPFLKIASRFYQSPDGRRHRVEILGEGQQFVAYGIHPDTGKPYRWVSLEEPDELDIFDLPDLTPEKANAIIEEFNRLALARGWEAHGLERNTNVDLDPETESLDFLRPKIEVDTEELSACLMAIENPGRDYDLWLQIGMALHHHFDGGETGNELWHTWSEQSDFYDSQYLDRKWESFGRYTGRATTVAFILKLGREERQKKAVAERIDRFESLKNKVFSASSLDMLMREISEEIAKSDLETYHRESLATCIQKHAKTLDAKLPIGEIRDRLAGKTPTDTADGRRTGLRLEVDLAHQVLREHWERGRHLKYFSKMFWEYRAGVWQRAEETVIQRRVLDTIIRLQDVNDERVTALAEMIADSRGDRLNATVSTVSSVIEKLIAEEGNDDPLNLLSKRAPMVINCANVELWFEEDGSMEVCRHDADHHLTSQIGCGYDPNAECPTWDAAIRRVFQSCDDPENVIRHFEEVFGYILQPTRHQAIWVMLKGPGGNGKSFLLEVISNVMGDRAVTASSIADLAGRISSHFTDGLQGKLMLLDDDLKAGTMLPDDWLKKLSEAKLISADPKFARSYTFTARSVPVLLTNQWPSTVDLSEGLRRRAVIFESNHVLNRDEKDPRHLQTILADELPGVLNRLIAGFRRFLRRGQNFDAPAEVQASMQRWSTSSNATALFASEALRKTGSRHDYLPAHVVYDAYHNWVRFHEHNVRELGRNRFYQALEALGFRRVNHSGRHMFAGVILRRVEGVEHVFDNLEDDADQGL